MTSQIRTVCIQHGSSSLTRGWVCRSQFLLTLAIAVILRSKSSGTHDHVCHCLRFKTPSTWRARSPYLFAPGTVWPSYTPRHWAPFYLSPTTRRATVYVIDLTYTSHDGIDVRTLLYGHYPETNKASAHDTLFLECRF
jgi:hypothetical protein